MPKSRSTGLACLLLASQGGQAVGQAGETITAEQALARSREMFPSVDDLDCPPAKGDEVVVCARRDAYDRYRLPLPVERTPGEIGPDDRFTTERLMNLNSEANCLSPHGCATAAIPVLQIVVFTVDKVLKAIKGEDLDSPPSPIPPH